MPLCSSSSHKIIHVRSCFHSSLDTCERECDWVYVCVLASLFFIIVVVVVLLLLVLSCKLISISLSMCYKSVCALCVIAAVCVSECCVCFVYMPHINSYSKPQRQQQYFFARLNIYIFIPRILCSQLANVSYISFRFFSPVIFHPHSRYQPYARVSGDEFIPQTHSQEERHRLAERTDRTIIN